MLGEIVGAIDAAEAKAEEKPQQITVFVPMSSSTSSRSIPSMKDLQPTGYTHWATGETLYMDKEGVIVTRNGVPVPRRLWDGVK